MEKEFNRFKDLSPEETVTRNKKILEDLGLKLKEDPVQRTNDIWTQGLFATNVKFHVNGKGTTKEFCRASAYGEALERLQNMTHTIDWVEASDEAANTYDFKYFSDEEERVIYGLFTDYPELFEILSNDFMLLEGRPLSNSVEGEGFLEHYIGSNKVKLIPFYDITKKEIVKLPLELVAILAGSTGMCSGNTPHEALVQGLSEVCERFVEPYIYDNQLTPPEVPREYIKKEYPYLNKIMSDMETKFGYPITVYDCSLGIGLPVLCICIIDQKNQRYRVQFGAQPNFSIALERCLTEILQGYDYSDYSNFFRSTEKFDGKDPWTASNLERRINVGNGRCNKEFFYKNPSWEFKPWEPIEDYDNKKGFKYIIDVLSKLTKDIYIRDNSFLGVPAYIIFIPGISTPPIPLGWHENGNEDFMNTLYNLDVILKALDSDEKRLLCQTMFDYISSENHNFLKEVVFNGLYDEESGKTEVPLGYSSTLIKAILYRKIGDMKSSIKELESLQTKDYNLFKAFALELKMQIYEVPENERNELIKQFAGEHEADIVKEYWRGEDYLNKMLKLENKPSESKTDNIVDDIYIKIRKAQIDNGVIDQNKLAELL